MPENLIWSSYFDFSGAENVDAGPGNLQDNEVMKAENVDFNIRGGFETRAGEVTLNSTSYGAQVEQNFEWKKANGSIQLMAVVGHVMCKIAEDGTKTEIQTLNPASKKCFHFAFQSYLLFGDGFEYYYYDETTCRTVSSTAPTVAPGLAGSGTSGSFTGIFKGKVTFVNKLGYETEASPAGISTSLSATAQIDWTNIPVGASDIVSRKLYRTKAGGEDYYLLTTIDDNTTTTYTDTKTDASLSQLMNTGNNLVAVKRCKYAVLHEQSYRWLFAGDSQNKTVLYYSEPNQPAVIKSESILYPTAGIGEISGLKMFGNAAIVFYDYGARKWSGIDPTKDVEWLAIPIPEGTASNDAITLVPSALTFLGRGGWWSMTPAILDYNLTIEAANDLVPNIAFGKQTKTIQAILRADIACSVYDPSTGFLMLAYTNVVGGERNARVLVNRWGTNSFWHYTGWQCNDWCLRANGDLLYAGNGFIYKVRTGINDAGSIINQRVESKKVTLGFPDNYKIVGKVEIKSGPRIEKSTIDLRIKSVSNSVLKTNIKLKTSREWTDPWNSPWGFKDSSLNEVNLDPALTGHEFQIVYSNDRLNEAMMIYSHSYGYKVKQPYGKKV